MNYYCGFVDFLVYEVLSPILQYHHTLIQLRIGVKMALGMAGSWLAPLTGLWGLHRGVIGLSHCTTCRIPFTNHLNEHGNPGRNGDWKPQLTSPVSFGQERQLFVTVALSRT